MLLAAAFVLSVGSALLIFRRARFRPRWIIATVILFALPAAFTLAVYDGPTERDWNHAYAQGAISYNAYQHGLAHLHEPLDIAAGIGLGGALLLIAFGVLFERVRAYDDRARATAVTGA